MTHDPTPPNNPTPEDDSANTIEALQNNFNEMSPEQALELFDAFAEEQRAKSEAELLATGREGIKELKALLESMTSGLAGSYQAGLESVRRLQQDYDRRVADPSLAGRTQEAYQGVSGLALTASLIEEARAYVSNYGGWSERSRDTTTRFLAVKRANDQREVKIREARHSLSNEDGKGMKLTTVFEGEVLQMPAREPTAPSPGLSEAEKEELERLNNFMKATYGELQTIQAGFGNLLTDLRQSFDRHAQKPATERLSSASINHVQQILSSIQQLLANANKTVELIKASIPYA